MLEVGEGMQSAAGKERLVGARRIGAVHRRFQHAGEIPVLVLKQVVDRPAGEPVSRGELNFS